MEERLSSEEVRQHYLELFLTIAHRSTSTLPVFSGDLSVVLRLRHRAVKDIIEAHFQELHQAYGRNIQIVRYRRRHGCRAMRGYLMPFQALIQLLPYFGGPGTALLSIPAVLHTYFCGEPYAARLN